MVTAPLSVSAIGRLVRSHQSLGGAVQERDAEVAVRLEGVDDFTLGLGKAVERAHQAEVLEGSLHVDLTAEPEHQRCRRPKASLPLAAHQKPAHLSRQAPPSYRCRGP